MTLEEFAIECGAVFFETPKDEAASYGGRWGYELSTSSKVIGYKTKKAAIEGWLIGKFGEQPVKIIMHLLKTQGKKMRL